MGKNRSGSLIVEAIIAVFILALTGLTLLDSLPLYKRAQKQVSQQEAVFAKCQEIGETILIEPSVGAKAEAIEINGKHFKAKREVLDSGSPGRLMVKVTILDEQDKIVTQRVWLTKPI